MNQQKLEEAIDRLQKFAPLWESMAIIQEALKELSMAEGAIERAQQREVEAKQAAEKLLIEAKSQAAEITEDARTTKNEAERQLHHAEILIEEGRKATDRLLAEARGKAAEIIAQGQAAVEAKHNGAKAQIGALLREVDTLTVTRDGLRADISTARVELAEIEALRKKLTTLGG